MKLIKWIFRIILILIIFLIIGSVVLLVVVYDKSDMDYNPKTEAKTMDYVIGEDLSNSLDTIYNTNYESDNNRINIGISSDTLNNNFKEIIIYQKLR